MPKNWLLLAAAPLAHAASFDCSKARTPIEKTICASPELSAADDQMAAAYKAALAQAPEAAELLRVGQREWLRDRAQNCSTKVSEAPLADCLRDSYKERTAFMARAVERVSGVTFVWNRIHLASPKTAKQTRDEDSAPIAAAGTLDAEWPVAASGTSEWKAWNKRLQEAARNGSAEPGCQLEQQGNWAVDSGADASVLVTLSSVSPSLVSATVSELCYSGGAHPNHGSVAFNWLLKEGRGLTAADVFEPKSGWDQWLAKRVEAQVHQTQLKAGGEDNPKDFDRVTKLPLLVQDPGHWELSPKGLKVFFNPYEIACYACTPEPVILRWSELKPYLNPAFKIPQQ
jgi:uncharacterized protein